MKKIELIGEIGTNHNGNLETAIKLIDMAKSAELDTIKLQIYDAIDIVSPLVESKLYIKNPEYKYWKDYINNKLITPKEWLPELVRYCKEINIGLLATVHSFANAQFCLNSGIERFKIASMDCNYYPFLHELTTLRKPILLSTGMATKEEIARSVEIIKSQDVHLTLFHCTATYPTRFEEANIRFFEYLRDLNPDKLGLSDHSINNDIVLMSMPFGIEVIEKHITLDNKQNGPDHSFALDFEGCKLWKEKVSSGINALGGMNKKMSIKELRNRELYRRKPILKNAKRKGSILTKEDIYFARPNKPHKNCLKIDTYELYIGRAFKIDCQANKVLLTDFF